MVSLQDKTAQKMQGMSKLSALLLHSDRFGRRRHSSFVCLVLAQVVVEPLVVPAVTQPLLRVNCFECMWSSYSWGGGGLTGPFPTAGAGGVDVMSGAKGVTLWRPKPPLGYAITGDVLTAGGEGTQDMCSFA
jgi:hypothetical protein